MSYPDRCMIHHKTNIKQIQHANRCVCQFALGKCSAEHYQTTSISLCTHKSLSASMTCVRAQKCALAMLIQQLERAQKKTNKQRSEDRHHAQPALLLHLERTLNGINTVDWMKPLTTCIIWSVQTLPLSAFRWPVQVHLLSLRGIYQECPSSPRSWWFEAVASWLDPIAATNPPWADWQKIDDRSNLGVMWFFMWLG